MHALKLIRILAPARVRGVHSGEGAPRSGARDACAAPRVQYPRGAQPAAGRGGSNGWPVFSRVGWFPGHACALEPEPIYCTSSQRWIAVVIPGPSGSAWQALASLLFACLASLCWLSQAGLEDKSKANFKLRPRKYSTPVHSNDTSTGRSSPHSKSLHAV